MRSARVKMHANAAYRASMLVCAVLGSMRGALLAGRGDTATGLYDLALALWAAREAVRGWTAEW